MIINANDLNIKYNKQQIVDLFCDSLMEKIQQAAKENQRKVCFNATIWKNERTGEVSTKYCRDHCDNGYAYKFSDYAEEIKKNFLRAGYIIKPTGYLGGIWQNTEEICW